MSEQQLADNFRQDIDNCIKKLKGNGTDERKSIVTYLNRLYILSAVLPILVTFISGYAYIITENVLTLFASLVDVLPPLLLKNAKDRLNFYNNCVALELNFTSLKSDINNLAVLGELKNNHAAIKQQLDGLKNSLNNALQIQI